MTSNSSLDPSDWEAFRALAHRMVDDAVDHMRDAREGPTWQPMPEEAKAAFRQPVPTEPTDLAAVYAIYQSSIEPYPTGNTHPRFFGYVHGSGTPVGALADFLAATLNSNVGGREHAAVYVERQVIAWFRELASFPAGASGIITTGTSQSNLLASVVARTAARERGASDASLVAYLSSAAHMSIRKGLIACGFDEAALRVTHTDANDRFDPVRLRAAIAEDRAVGKVPFLIVGTAGTVDTGAIDDLPALAAIAREEHAWFHVDGAFGAMALLDDALRTRVAGIELADSLAFDFHKWLHVPYDAGCFLVRDGELHERTFASRAAYLKRNARGIAAGQPWFSDFGTDLSRGFRALKVWFTLMHYGTRRLGDAVRMNCEQAQTLAAAIDGSTAFERVAPVALSVVCFTCTLVPDADRDVFNDTLAVSIQESGVAVISTTSIRGRTVLRVNLTNHRTTASDLDLVLDALRAQAERLVLG